jgi:alpha-ketoglutarate-dependent taurine dioxygenase
VTRPDKPSFRQAPGRDARPRPLSPGDLVRTGFVSPERRFPLLVEPRVAEVDLAAWTAAHLAGVEAYLLAHGAILFRGFDVPSAESFERAARAVAPVLLDYRERAAPRKEVGQGIFTSTEYPPEHEIPLHHEMSYSHNWPTKIWFYCAQPASQRGATPVAADREVFGRLPHALKEPFLRKKVMYVRNYGEGVDLPWQEAFQTSDRAAVEEYCRGARVAFEWLGRDRLRTRQVRQAVATHPRTGDTVWFNHAHMFHESNLPPAARATLLAAFAPDELPRNAFYGDGTPIEEDVLVEVRRTYDAAAVVFDWRAGDVMLLDNFLASHGRQSFAGARRILVAMAELYTNTDL